LSGAEVEKKVPQGTTVR